MKNLLIALLTTIIVILSFVGCKESKNFTIKPGKDKLEVTVYGYDNIEDSLSRKANRTPRIRVLAKFNLKTVAPKDSAGGTNKMLETIPTGPHWPPPLSPNTTATQMDFQIIPDSTGQ